MSIVPDPVYGGYVNSDCMAVVIALAATFIVSNRWRSS